MFPKDEPIYYIIQLVKNYKWFRTTIDFQYHAISKKEVTDKIKLSKTSTLSLYTMHFQETHFYATRDPYEGRTRPLLMLPSLITVNTKSSH